MRPFSRIFSIECYVLGVGEWDASLEWNAAAADYWTAINLSNRATVCICSIYKLDVGDAIIISESEVS